MKRLMMVLAVVLFDVLGASAASEVVDGVTWSYTVSDGEASVYERSYYPAIPSSTTGVLTIPATLGGYPVTSIGSYAFYGCSGLTSVTIPDGVTSIGDHAFYNCSGLTSVTIPEGVTNIGHCAFCGCSSLSFVDLPSSLVGFGGSDWPLEFCSAFHLCHSIISATLPDRISVVDIFPDSSLKEVTILSSSKKICDRALQDCRALKSVTIADGITEIGESAFEDCRQLEKIIIPASVKKIDDYAFYGCGRLMTVEYSGEKPEIADSAFIGTPNNSVVPANTVCVVSTNVVVQYVLNSVQPQFALPATQDMGFVNIITEVKSSGVAVIPDSWADNFSDFVSSFGSDFFAALGKKTGKLAADGTPMLVWQDYVAGTDPTKADDVFTASITVVDGKVTISHSPELDAERKAMRKYTTWGKRSLLDTEWSEVASGKESEYNFFKVTVEMK